MWVIIGCILLVLAGLLAVVRWGGLAVHPPPPPETAGGTGRPPVSLVVRRYLWSLTVAVMAGFGAGVLAAGAGGRLVMRLLAVTSGPAAQGQVTEAGQIVGRITVGGTISFIVFTALFVGLPSGAAYLLLRRWLPVGWAGGLTYGVLLLVVAGTRVEPLRRGNPDFDLVGPGWVSVAAFATLMVLHGMLVAALAGRVSRAVPLLAPTLPAATAHAPLLLLVPLGSILLVLAVVGAAIVLLSRSPQVVAACRAHGLVAVGQVALAVAGLLALPGFVSAIVNILGRA
jgi:hypothetical protein